MRQNAKHIYLLYRKRSLREQSVFILNLCKIPQKGKCEFCAELIKICFVVYLKYCMLFICCNREKCRVPYPRKQLY